MRQSSLLLTYCKQQEIVTLTTPDQAADFPPASAHQQPINFRLLISRWTPNVANFPREHLVWAPKSLNLLTFPTFS